jgi:hypothetical protein
MYDSKQTKISLGVLVELNEALREYRDSYVLGGGWAPYFITKGEFDHCGSLDIDLILRPQIFTRYETIRESISALGFDPTESPFRFSRNIDRNAKIELDFLSEPEALNNIPKKFVEVQEGVKAAIVPGSSLVFTFNTETQFSGTTPDGSELETKMRVSDIVSMVALKGHAIGRPLKLEKDSYDLYAVCGFVGGEPKKAAEMFNEHIKNASMIGGQKQFVKEGLTRTRQYFATQNSRGPIAVSRFYGTDDKRRVDSYQRVRVFLENVQYD